MFVKTELKLLCPHVHIPLHFSAGKKSDALGRRPILLLLIFGSFIGYVIQGWWGILYSTMIIMEDCKMENVMILNSRWSF